MCKVRLVVAGCGLVGKRHIAAIEQVTDASLVGVVDVNDAAEAYAKTLGVSFSTDLNELLNRARPDGVILSTPTPLHVEQALTCLEHKCSVLVEKPLATSSEAAAVLIQRANDQNIPILVGHHRRHNPLIQKAKSLIESGSIGSIRAIHAQCWLYKPDHYFKEAPWRTQIGAGPISVNLVHDVDLVRFLCGEITRVTAYSAPSSRGFDNEEVAAAIIEFENQAVGTISVADGVVSPWSWELTAREYPAYPSTQETCYRIGGSLGSLSIPDLTLWTQHGKQDWWEPIHATSVHRTAADPLVNQIAHFLEVIRGIKSPLVSGEEGLKTLKVIESIQISSKCGTTVNLN